MMEAIYEIKYGETCPVLSEQQMMDCSKAYGNMSCMGGISSYGWDYHKIYPITSEASYPYEAKDRPCRFNYEDHSPIMTTGRNARIKSDSLWWEDGSAEDLRQAISLGPVQVSVCADNESGVW